MDDILKTAKNCRHYAMCKIDFLGTGVCASGIEKHYVSFYPQGRMDLYAALIDGRIPVTEKCIEIADTCNLCGKCDKQCYFVTQLRPTKVMKALKDYVDEYIKSGKPAIKEKTGPVLDEIRKIVGEYWATSDPAVLVTYSDDPCPLAAPRLPEYVIMPETQDEVSLIMKLLKEKNIPFAVRGNGSSVMGFVMSEGAVIDMGRMKEIEFDEKNWAVRAGAGVSAFDLQAEAVKKGYRVNVAEPAALVCSNIMCSGIFSTFSASYGTAGSNYIDASFVDPEGKPFSLNGSVSPNLFGFNTQGRDIPGICTSVTMKLHPVTDDEKGILVPFNSLAESIDFARELSIRRIGLSVSILGGEYISTFLAPTKELAWDVKEAFTDKLKMAHPVLVIGDRFAVNSIREMNLPFIEDELFKTICLGMPSLNSAPWLELLDELEQEEPYSYLRLEQFNDLAETALSPSAEKLTSTVDPDLRDFFKELYERPEMTDLVWLSMFRILSSRMGREKHVVAFIVYTPLENQLLIDINNDFKRIADKYSIKNDYGFITPLDMGKRCVFEFDYYIDQINPDEIRAMQQAIQDVAAMIHGYSAQTETVRWIRYVLYQGFSRMEYLLYS